MWMPVTAKPEEWVMKPSHQARSRNDPIRRRGWCRDEYCVYTRIMGSTVELHATHQSSGEQFISRAEDWETVVSELDNLVTRHGPSGRGAFRDICDVSARAGASFSSSISHMLTIAAKRMRDAIQERKRCVRVQPRSAD